MPANYWIGAIQNRISRRRALASSAGLGLGAAALSLIGCGGSTQSGKQGPTGGSGLAIKPIDTTKQAKPGGSWVLHHPADPPNLDPLSTQFFGTNFQGYFVYSRAIKYKVGSVDSPPRGEPEGDAFSSWELSPDKLALTFKLRNGLKFEPQPPVNGRPVTVEDVKWSWDRLSALHVSRSSFINSLNPDAPIVSMQTPDPQTIVFKLASPYVPIIAMFGVQRGFVIEPIEAESKFDPRNEMHGSGPWMLTKYTPSVGLEFKRNPNWYVENRPFIENISRPIIKEYAQQVAQFESGALAQVDVRQEDLLPLRKRQPKMLLLSTGWDLTYPYVVSFDWKPTSVFKDVRVRRALSMLLDRDLWIESIENLKAFKAEGIDVPTRWHSHFGAGDDRYWLDPKSGKLGEGSQYFKFNPDEAKKLLKAAGHEGMAFPVSFQAGIEDQSAQVLAGMWEQNGALKPSLNPLDNATWTKNYHAGGGKGDGVVPLHPGNGVDVDVWLDTRVRYNASPYVPYTEPLPKIDDLCKAQKKEFDEKKRTELILEIEREMALQMISVPSGGGPSSSPGLGERHQLSWPWLANFGYVQPHIGFPATEAFAHYWYDESKRV